jgi:hypothetical protein
VTIERFASAGPYEDVIGYSRVVRADGWLVTAGCTLTMVVVAGLIDARMLVEVELTGYAE